MTIHNHAQAARRHHADAQLLETNGRVPNADHLYGFAAECALVSIIRSLPGTDAYFGPDGAVIEGSEGLRHHVHTGKFWRNFKNIAQGHRGGSLLSKLGYKDNPLGDWGVDQRYYGDADCAGKDRMEKHRDAATRLLELLQAALQAETKRVEQTARPAQGGGKTT